MTLSAARTGTALLATHAGMTLSAVEPARGTGFYTLSNLNCRSGFIREGFYVLRRRARMGARVAVSRTRSRRPCSLRRLFPTVDCPGNSYPRPLSDAEYNHRGDFIRHVQRRQAALSRTVICREQMPERTWTSRAQAMEGERLCRRQRSAPGMPLSACVLERAG
jgi:hypothetical protein